MIRFTKVPELLSEYFRKSGKLTQLDIDFVVKLAQPQRELGGTGHPGGRLHQVGPHVLRTVRAGVESGENL